MSDKERLLKRTRTKRFPEAVADVSEIFDDSDYYQLLLRDLMQNKQFLTPDLALPPMLKQHKPNVDPKASKGRRIR